MPDPDVLFNPIYKTLIKYDIDLDFWDNEMMKKTEPMPDNVKELQDLVAFLRTELTYTKNTRDQWKTAVIRRTEEVKKLEKDINEAKKVVTAEDIRRIVNRVCKIHRLPTLNIKKEVPKDVFLASISNHLNYLLSKEIPVEVTE